MVAHAGEKARKSGDFICERCNTPVQVSGGQEIPKCPNCGNTTFDERRHEPDRG